MRPIALFCLACTFLLGACATTGTRPVAEAAATPQRDADSRFQSHVAIVLEEMWREFPEFALRAGNYKYADQMSVPDQARRDRSKAFYDR